METPPLVARVLALAESQGLEAPFDLLFVDANDAKDDVDAAVGLLAPGGTAVLDDFWFDPALPDLRRRPKANETLTVTATPSTRTKYWRL